MSKKSLKILFHIQCIVTKLHGKIACIYTRVSNVLDACLINVKVIVDKSKIFTGISDR